MKKFLFLLLAAIVAVSAFAAPAYRKPFAVRQSDGTELTVILTGDEALHYYVTTDGKPLVKEENGDFYYATFSNGVFVSTKCLAHNSERRDAAENELLSSIDYSAMNSDISKASCARSAKYSASAQKVGSQITPVGDVNIAVLLVQYKDVKFTYTKEDMNNILNAKDYIYKNPIADGIGSARDYFIAQSDNKFRPNFIVTDIVTLDNNMAYYGGNDSSGDDKKPTHMVKEGIVKADAAGFDFSVCDNDGDGEVEFIYCIYAGYSESYGASANTIWPHQWYLSAQAGSVTVDGVKCNTYACSGELVYNSSYENRIGKTLAGIGLICHEFSHCLGLPDIYDTSYDSGNWGMEYWDLMDQGNYAAEGYVPVGYSAYQRDFCGWRDLVEINSKGEFSMLPLTQGGVAYKVVNDANPNEYYILENRKQESWDTYLFGSGMLVVHVDYLKSAWDYNIINNTKNHPRYTIIPADNKLVEYSTNGSNTNEYVASLKGDVWPGTSGNTELTNTSIPAAKVYTGGYMNKPIRDIQYKNDIISFCFMGGYFAEAPRVLAATDVTDTSFKANWEAVDGAEEYAVEVYKIAEVENGAGEPTVLMSEDFLGFTKTNTNVSNEINSYTVLSGWIAENVYSENGVLRVGTAGKVGSLTTPSFMVNGNVTLSFDTELYNVDDTGVVLTVTIYSDERAVSTLDIEPASGFEKYTISTEVNGELSVEFRTKNSISSLGKKRANIDNVVITTESTVSTELVVSKVTDRLFLRFDGLDGGCRYRYRVQARDEYGSSDYSEYMEVSVLPTSITELKASGDVFEIYDVSGVKVYDSRNGDAMVLPRGLYVVVTASGARKVYIE